MKHVAAPVNEQIRIRNLYDDEMFEEVGAPTLPSGKPNPDAGKRQPAMAVYQKFLLDRTKDPKFFTHGGVKEGIEALELLQLTRKQIAATKGVSGVHSFDDDVAHRLQECILKPSNRHLGAIDFEHNWYEWVLLWKTLYSEIPAVLATSTNQSLEAVS